MRTRATALPALALALLAAAPAAAATFLVNVKTDAPDARPGDGRCNIHWLPIKTPQCSLRAAVQTANETPALDIIELQNGTHTLTLAGAGEDAAATGDLDVTSQIELASDIVSGDSSLCFIEGKKLGDRLFDVKPGGNLDLRRVTLQNARTATGEGGGCMRSAGTVTLARMFFYRCASSDDGGGLSLIDGTADIANVIFSSNSATNEGGGLEIGALATATLRNVTAGANRAGIGGAFAVRGEVTLENATLDRNKGKASGGVALLGAEPVTIESSTISQNGNVNLDASQATGGVTISNTIVWGAKTADCVGDVTSAGGNLEGGTSCAFTGTNDQQGDAAGELDPELLPLNFYDGFVPTRAIASTSPAIDHGVDPPDLCLNRDTRNLRRFDADPVVNLAVIDAGSYEFRGASTGPSISSTAPVSATVGALYTYDVGTDPAVVGPFSLDVAPSGMTIASDTGVIQWTPAADQVGDQDVTVRATGTMGLCAQQRFVVEVEAAP